MEIDLGRVLNTLPSIVWTALPDGHIDFVNRRWSEYTGLSLDEAKALEWQAAIDADDLPQLLDRWQSILASGQPGEMEARVRRFDGQYRWFLIQSSPLHDDVGRIIRWYGTNTDIDERKHAEEALSASERASRLIVDSIPGMVAVFLPGGKLERVNRQLLAYYGKTLEELKRWEAGELTHPEDLPRAVEVFTQSLASGEPFEVEVRARRFDGVYRWFQSRGLPLRDADGHIVCWYNLLVDIDERKRAEEALLQSEAQLAKAERDLQLTIDTIPVFVSTYTPDGTRNFVNRTWQDYIGLTLEEATGPSATLFPHVHPADVERNDNAWRASLARGEPLTIDVRVRRADGQYRWHTSRRVPLRDEKGSIVRWYSVGIDIDDQKRAEEALLASEREARLIVDSIPGGIEVLSPAGEVEAVNEHVARYFGRTADELKLTGLTELIHPEDLQLVRDTAARSTTTGVPYDAVHRFLGADGKYRWFNVRGLPLRDADGRVVRWYALHIDIDDQKRAEEALAASARNLKQIVNTIPALAWSARPDGSAEFFNQLYLDYMGLSAEQAQDWGWTVAVHPDDLNSLAATWQAMLASGQPGEAEARLRRFDGTYRWFLFRANPLRDELGNIIKWYGTNTDIDDRKRAEEALRESERQSRLIVDTIPGLVAIFGPGGEIEGLNEQFLGYLGQTLEEFANWATNGTVHPDDLAGHVETLTQSLDSGHPIDFETRLRRFDGIYRWFQLRGHPARDSDGRIVRWYCLMTDVDDRKRAEDELRRSEAFLADAQRLSRTGSFSWQVAAEEMEWSEETYRIYELDPRTPVTFDLVRARVHPDNLSTLQEVMGRARREGGDFDYETRLLMPDQSVKHLRVVAHSVRNKDGKIELRGAVQDVTAGRLAEEALEKVRSELGHVTRIMSLGALTASIAHEVNQPLSGIITNASTCLRMLAADPPKIDIAQETARRTIRDGNRAADVIARLRALFTKRTATIEPVDLNDAVREVIALSSSEIQRGRVVLRTELADELPPVGGDRIQLQQVVMNLVRNATDAMSGVDDRPRRLVIRTEPDEEAGIRLSVKDVGIGFGPAGAERVFETFYTTKGDGMGIGLSVSRSIIEMHNGRLWAKPNDGPGVTFCFSIPEYFGDETSLHQAGAMQAPVTGSAQNAAGIS